MIVVLVGNPIDGFNIIGPFLSSTDAIEYADNELGKDTWWITEIESPE